MSAETLAAKLDALWLDLSDDRDIPVERARILNTLHDAAQALRTPPAPMEAVAWRFWHEGGWNFSSTDPSPHLADCVERDALAIIPAPTEPEWITHDGGPNPVPGKTVDVRYRNGETETRTANRLGWNHWEAETPGLGGYDIIAYRVTEGVKP